MKVIYKEELVPFLRELFQKAQKSVYVVSAWIRGSTFKELISLLKENIELEVIVRAGNLSDMDVTDVAFFRETKNKGGKIYLNPKLHAKFLIIDEKYAVLGSSNITFMGLYPEGNVEANLYIEEEEKVKELLEFYRSLKEESFDYTDTVGFVLSGKSSKEAEILLLENVKEQTYVKIPTEEGFTLARISKITTSKELKSEVANKILKSELYDYEVASFFAYFNENPEISTAKIEVLGNYEEERNLFKTPNTPLNSGLTVKKLSEDDKELEKIMKKNHSGYDMKYPVYIGKLYETNIKAYLDMDKVIPMHMAVLGATGSGKTTFVKKVLKNFKYDAEVYIIDIYGEYAEEVEGEELKIKNILIPLSVEDIKELFKEAGAVLEERSTEEKEFFSVFRQALKPDIEMTELRRRSLKEIFEDAMKFLVSRYLRTEAENAYSYLERTYGKEALTLQPQILTEVRRILNSESKVKIFNFKEVDITETKINLTGLILREIFIKAKNEQKDRIVVLEEAQNVAPEKGTAEVPTGKENLAFTFTKKIALEGRKLRLGLVAITQRPASISKFILSQLNTQIIFKLIVKNDLDAVSQFFEQSKEDIFRLLPSLKPGTAFASGLGVPFSFLFQMEEIPYY